MAEVLFTIYVLKIVSIVLILSASPGVPSHVGKEGRLDRASWAWQQCQIE